MPDIGINDMPHLPQRESVEALNRRGLKVFYSAFTFKQASNNIIILNNLRYSTLLSSVRRGMLSGDSLTCGVRHYSIVNELPTDVPEGFNYFMAFFWTFLNVSSPIFFLALLLRWRVSQGFVGIYWGPWDEKSAGVSTDFITLLSNKPEQRLVTLRRVYRRITCNPGFGSSYLDLDLSSLRVF